MNSFLVYIGMYCLIHFCLVVHASAFFTFHFLLFSLFFFQLSIMKDEPEEAELILHDALRLAYESENKKAITYTYDLVTLLTNLSP